MLLFQGLRKHGWRNTTASFHPFSPEQPFLEICTPLLEVLYVNVEDNSCFENITKTHTSNQVT